MSQPYPPHYPPQHPPPVRVEGPVEVEQSEQVEADLRAIRRDVAVIALWFKLLTAFAVLGLVVMIAAAVLVFAAGAARR